MAAQSQQRQVNLLPTDRFEYSTAGRFLKWALTTGKYLVIVTELVVIIAFLSRFWFDRTLTDLRESRIKKEAIVDSFQQVLADFLRTQSQLRTIRSILTEQYGADDRLAQLQALTPSGIEYGTISVSSDSATLRGFSPSSNALSVFLSSLQSATAFDRVAVPSLGLSADRAPGMDFEVSLHYAEVQKGKPPS